LLLAHTDAQSVHNRQAEGVDEVEWRDNGSTYSTGYVPDIESVEGNVTNERQARGEVEAPRDLAEQSRQPISQFEVWVLATTLLAPLNSELAGSMTLPKAL
jgi:hypothetical protein